MNECRRYRIVVKSGDAELTCGKVNETGSGVPVAKQALCKIVTRIGHSPTIEFALMSMLSKCPSEQYSWLDKHCYTAIRESEGRYSLCYVNTLVIYHSSQ